VLRLIEKDPDKRPGLAEIRSTLAAIRDGRAPVTAATAAVAAPKAGAAAGGGWASASSGRRALYILLIVLGVAAAATISFLVVRAARG
jgi:hypothetical protein